MSQNPQVVQHRLGIARKALKDMDRETDKSRKRREAEQRVYIERVAREVAKEVDR